MKGSGEPGSGDVILAIETSHSRGSVALGAAGPAGGAPLVEPFPIGLVHGREILPRIDTLVRRAGTPRTAITLVAVSAGPGSYTGIRIGVAAAKALAWALGVPALAIPTLEVIARNAPADGDLAVILDARRGACYGATFRRRGGRIERTGDDRVAPPGEFLETLPEGTRLIGQGAYTLPGTDRFPRFGEESAIPRAELVHAAAGERLTAIRAGTLQPPPEFADPHLLVPSYLRPSEAEERAAARKQRGEEA